MSHKPYIPIPVFDTVQDVVHQHKTIYADEKPHYVIRQWLTHCFSQSKISLPDFAVKDYQTALNFLYNYRGVPWLSFVVAKK